MDEDKMNGGGQQPGSVPLPGGSPGSVPAGSGPVPGPVPAPGPVPGPVPAPDAVPGDPDPEWTEYVAWRDREIAAGRHDPVPEEWEIEGPSISLSLGDAADIDPALLAAACGPDGLGGQSLGPQFAQDQPADVLRPGPVLSSLSEQAITNPARLSDDELIGVLRASRRLEAREAYKQAVVTAEFARRREAEFAAATRRGTAAGCRPGAFPGEELAGELLVTRGEASRRIDAAADLVTRLPATFAGMAAGLIDAARADVIASYTRSLTPADAAYADGVLAAAAPSLRVDQLARRAAALEMKLDPEAVKARREHARQTRQRVEVRQEDSGNAALSGRELPPAQALASKANIDALAARLRAAGLAGTLDQLRATVLTDLTQSRNPLDRIIPALVDPVPAPADLAPAPAEPAAPGAPARLPALINLLVPIGTLLGWSTAPAQAGGWGLLDAEETRDTVATASLDPRTRWCMTILGFDGTAIAHGCSPGQHPWTPQDPREPPPAIPQAIALADLLYRLNITVEPISTGTCGHHHAESRYTPSRKLTHLIRARNSTCTAPGCGNQAVHCDLDHTTPYPHGPTCECNLGPKCRTHHRAKQAPDWKAEQPAPGTFRWTMPSGRTYTTRPTVYGP